MRIVHYCQHVLGVGHLARSLEILRGLAGHQVTFVTGGRELELPLPEHAQALALPGLMMTEDFSAMYAVQPGRSLDEVKAERTRLLTGLLQDERPDAFLVELFPFGRNGFRFELLPALKLARQLGAKIVCSLRDVLVEKSDQAKYEARVLDRANQYFDAIAVHADPNVLPLSKTFGRMADLRPRVAYTGYVTPKPAPGAGSRLRSELSLAPGEKLLVASAGGGAVGGPLLSAVLQAFSLLRTPDVRLAVFTGPYLDDETFAQLATLAERGGKARSIRLKRFSNRFPDWLAAADASVSQAGYNTTMNLLAAGTPALVQPFDQNREQRMRAERLQNLGALEVLEGLEPAALAGRLDPLLAKGRGTAPLVDMDGAAKTVRLLEELTETPGAGA